MSACRLPIVWTEFLKSNVDRNRRYSWVRRHQTRPLYSGYWSENTGICYISSPFWYCRSSACNTTSTLSATFAPNYKIRYVPGRAQLTISSKRCILIGQGSCLGVFFMSQGSYSIGCPEMRSYLCYVSWSLHDSWSRNVSVDTCILSPFTVSTNRRFLCEVPHVYLNWHFYLQV